MRLADDFRKSDRAHAKAALHAEVCHGNLYVVYKW
jgi:hypothetical protein